MDDRFDWIFVSAAILQETNDINYLDGTYVSFGNDGNHCNQAINDGENSAVSQSIANALHEASDHLPENSFVNITIRDLLGRHVRTLINQFQDAGSKSVNWNATNANNAPIPSGIYFCILKVGQFEGITKIILLK